MEFSVGRALIAYEGDTLHQAYIKKWPPEWSQTAASPVWAVVKHKEKSMTLEVIVHPSADTGQLLLPPNALEFLRATPKRSSATVTLRDDFVPSFASKASVAPQSGAESYAPVLRKFFTMPRLFHYKEVFTLPLHDADDFEEEPVDARKCKLWVPSKVSRDGIADFAFVETVTFQISYLDGTSEPMPMLISTDHTELQVSGVLHGQRELPLAVHHLHGVLPMPILPSLQRAHDLLMKTFAQAIARRPCGPKILISGPRGVGKRTIIHLCARKLGFLITEINCFALAGTGDNAISRVIREAQGPACIILRRFQAFTIGHVAHHTNVMNQQKLSAQIRATVDKVARDKILVLIASVEDSADVVGAIRDAFDLEISVPRPCEASRMEAMVRLSGFEDVELAKKMQGFSYDDIRAAMRTVDVEGINGRIKEIAKRQTASVTAAGVESVKWSDVGGMDTAKREVIDCITLPLSISSKSKLRSGILLFGPPGTGKTLLAKAVATECKVNFISVKGPELLSMYIGESEKNVRSIFQSAVDAQPCVLFFDELDSLAPARGRGSDSGGVMDRIVSQLLTEVDGLPSKVFMIGATNRPDLLDTSLLRPGRLDRMVYLGIAENKLPIFQAATRKFDFNQSILPSLAQKCPPNFTGADIAAVCSDAYMVALKEKTVQLEMYAKSFKMPLQAFLTGLVEGDIEDTLRERVAVKEPLGKILSVFVLREHFEEAMQSVNPSVPMEDVIKYEQLRDSFSNTS